MQKLNYLIVGCFFVLSLLEHCGPSYNVVEYTSALERCETKSRIDLVTWNIFKGNNKNRIEQTLKKGHPRNANILLFQEVTSAEASASSAVSITAKEIAGWFGYDHYSHANNAIVSDFDIDDYGYITIDNETGRTAIYADIEYDSSDSIRLYSVHLAFKKGNMNIFDTGMRRDEMESLLNHADSFNGPIIIAGDMNSVVNRRSYYLEDAIKLIEQRAYIDAFKDIGHFVTHPLLGRIDWVFFRDLTLMRARIGDYDGSDHRWLMVTLCME